MTDTSKKPADDKAEDNKTDTKTGTTEDAQNSGDNKADVPEVGGRGGLDPTRYGDWEIGGRCVDF